MVPSPGRRDFLSDPSRLSRSGLKWGQTKDGTNRECAMSLNLVKTNKSNKIKNLSEQTTDGNLTCRGDGNYVEIEEGCSSAGMNIDVGSDCVIKIGKQCVLTCVDIYCGDRGIITIGEGSTFNFLIQIRCHEPSAIEIGAGFLCGGGVLITTSDMHSIFDIVTGKRINNARDILIGSSVWIGQAAYILKGSIIGSGSVIGAKALVSGEIPGNVIAAGVPAKVIRTGIYWKHEL
jgi:acetyltransferase-like isoleucine patch superfamily enzyme